MSNVDLTDGERELIDLLHSGATEDFAVTIIASEGAWRVMLIARGPASIFEGEGPSFEAAWADLSPEAPDPETPRAGPSLKRLLPRLRVVRDEP